MPNGQLRRAILAHLGHDTAGRGLTSVQDYRTSMVSLHQVRSPEWRWAAHHADRPVTAVVFASEGALAVDGGAPVQGGAVLLHSTHNAALRWAPDSTATVVWLETDTVVDDNAPAAGRPVSLQRTPLVRGLQAFAESLTAGPEAPSNVSDFIVERLLVEMAYGTLLEHRETDAAHRQAVRPLHRARMLLLVNRADPNYDTTELARDLHVSTRQLQRLFARESTSPAAELRNLRAELALSLLRDPKYDDLATSQIATHAGFTNSAAMRRGLHAIGAPTPQAARER